MTDATELWVREGQCDCCGAYPRELSHVVAFGIETCACAACCGDDNGDTT